MTRRIRTTRLLTVLTIGAGLFLAVQPAQAQRNTYEDFPYNQGSLFYRYLPPKKKTRTVYRPVVQPTPAPARPAYTYPPQYSGAAPNRYYYNPQTRSYYYYPTNPAPTQPVRPATPR
jgi:hypothetical protein